MKNLNTINKCILQRMQTFTFQIGVLHLHILIFLQNFQPLGLVCLLVCYPYWINFYVLKYFIVNSERINLWVRAHIVLLI